MTIKQDNTYIKVLVTFCTILTSVTGFYLVRDVNDSDAEKKELRNAVEQLQLDVNTIQVRVEDIKSTIQEIKSKQ